MQLGKQESSDQIISIQEIPLKYVIWLAIQIK